MSLKSTISWVTVFSIAMGYLETAVVVYLRALYYPKGFDFPLQPIETQIAVTEFFRELATVIMLAGIGYIAGKTFAERFAYFIYSFAIWDIFYYVFLKVLLNWPESLMTWDILFLIPVTWVGPVISPVIVSIIMIIYAGVIIYYSNTNKKTKINRLEWITMLFGAFIIFISFIWDYCGFILNHYSFSQLWSLNFDNKALFDLSMKYVPVSFIWPVFIVGIIVLIFSIVLFYKRNKKLLQITSES